MAKVNNYLSMAQRGLRYKLRIAFSLMSILPLLVCLYLVSNYILPHIGLKVDIIVSISVSIFIAAAGFFVIKEIFDRIVSVSSEAKRIAAGDISRSLEISEADEVGDLSHALNQLTARIRTNMDELKSYGEKTSEINMEIQKRVLILSSLLQISSLISQGTSLDEILKIVVEKSRLLANSETVYLLFRQDAQESFFMKIAEGPGAAGLLKIKASPKEAFFEKTVNINKPLIIDKQNLSDKNLSADFCAKFQLKNTLALPVYLRGKIIAVLGIGNTKDSFLYRKEDVELLDIFAKQIAIAAENDILMHRVEKLEIRDALTGLFNKEFIRNRLDEEIKRAITYQRPCAFIIVGVDNFTKFHHDFGSLQAEGVLKKISSLIKDSTSDVDRVGRTGDDEFCVILPEKNKRQAQEIAETIRKKVEFVFSEAPDANKKITVSGGVSENPLDGINAQELILSAEDSLKLAKSQGKNRMGGIK